MSPNMITTLLIVLFMLGGTLLGVAIWLWRGSSTRQQKPDPAINRCLHNVRHTVT